MRERTQGFTIVELLAVVTIIAVLAGITIFAFGSWRMRTAQTEMKNELYAASSSLKSHRTFNNNFPVSLMAMGYRGSNNITLVYSLRGDGLSYCLDAGDNNVPSAPHWYIDSAVSMTPTTTMCT